MAYTLKWVALNPVEANDWSDSGVVTFLVPLTEDYVSKLERLYKRMKPLLDNNDIAHVAAYEYEVTVVDEYTQEDALETLNDILDTTEGYGSGEPVTVKISTSLSLHDARGNLYTHVTQGGELSWNFFPKYGDVVWGGWLSIGELRHLLDSPNGEEETQANG